MTTITIGNSYSKILGLSLVQSKELQNLLSYTVGGKAAYFSGFGIRRKSLLSSRGEFPTGLQHIVFKYLHKNNIVYKIINLSKAPLLSPSKYKLFLPFKPHASQVKACQLATSLGRGTISMPTGSGKSLVIAMIAFELDLKTLVVCPNLEIKKQLQGILKDLKNVTIENIDSPKLSALKDFDCLIIDEAHHSSAKTYQKLNRIAWTNIFYRFFFTATPFRNDTEETLLFEAIAGQVIYRLDYKTAVAEGYIVPVEAYYIEIPKSPTDAYTYAQVYKELVVNNTVRNYTIVNLLITLQQNSVYTLCLVKEVEHGKILEELSGIPFVSGDDESSRQYIKQFNNGEIKTLIGTTGILGEGIDTKPCEYVVIAGLGKAKSQFMQQVGRAVRKYKDKTSAKIILIKDKSHKFTTRHFNAQRAILREEYGSKCQELESAFGPFEKVEKK